MLRPKHIKQDTPEERAAFEAERLAAAAKVREAISQEQEVREDETDTERVLKMHGLFTWSKNGLRRIYINGDYSVERIFGLRIERYKSGSIKHAFLNGEAISNNKAWKMLLHTPYYDCIAGKWVCHPDLVPEPEFA